MTMQELVQILSDFEVMKKARKGGKNLKISSFCKRGYHEDSNHKTQCKGTTCKCDCHEEAKRY